MLCVSDLYEKDITSKFSPILQLNVSHPSICCSFFLKSDPCTLSVQPYLWNKFEMHAFPNILNPCQTAWNRNCTPWQTGLFSWQSTWSQKFRMTLYTQSYCQQMVVFTWKWKIMKPERKHTFTLGTNKRTWQQPWFQLVCSPSLTTDENWVGDNDMLFAMMSETLPTLFVSSEWYCVLCSDQVKLAPILRITFICGGFFVCFFFRQILGYVPYTQKRLVVRRFWYWESASFP